ncbi:MAG: rhodanese-like domain-containing protein [Clostridia bacterium]
MPEKARLPEEPVGADELNDMLKSDSAPLLIDVRQPEEFELGHIPGAVSSPLGQLDIAARDFDPDRPIVTYCRSGVRGDTAARLLARRGFQARTLEGGLSSWPYETVRGPARAVSEEKLASVPELLIVAVLREIAAAEFYTTTSQRVTNPAAQEILEYLAVMEEGHTDRVYSKYVEAAEETGERVRSVDDLRSTATRSIGNWELKDGVVVEVARDFDVDIRLKDPEDPAEVMDKAVAWEFESYDFYRRSAELLSDEELRSLLIELAFEERTHANMILRTLGSLGGV